MTTKEFVEQAEFPKWGYWTDWTGATRKVKIVAETTDGRYVIVSDSLPTLLVNKNKVILE